MALGPGKAILRVWHGLALLAFLGGVAWWPHFLRGLQGEGEWTEEKELQLGGPFLLMALVIVLGTPSILHLIAPAFRRWVGGGDSTESSRTRFRGWLAVGTVLLLLAAHASFPDHWRPRSWSGFYIFLIIGCWLPVVLFITLRHLEGRQRSLSGMRLRPSWTGFGLAGLLLVLAVVISHWTRRISGTADEQHFGLVDIPSIDHFPILIIVALSAGIAEELLFRGFLLTRIRELTGSTRLALLFTSVLFGMMHIHLGWHHALGTGLIGLCIGAAVIWRGNLFAAVLVHCWIDLFAAMATAVMVLRG